jgi:hypothetical protein
MVRNESVRFGRHIDTKVSYKILEVPKLVLILHYPTYFQKGLFGGSFEQNTLRPSGVNLVKGQYIADLYRSHMNFTKQTLKCHGHVGHADI